MASCAACREPLTVAVEADSGDDDDSGEQAMAAAISNAVVTDTVVPDDVELPCGCHFHWQCLLDSYTHTECPNCSRNLTDWSTSGEQQLLCNITNEGGLQKDLDILPLLTEEAYLRAYPEERRCRAFLEFCREGDIEAVASVVNEAEDEDDDSPTTSHDILRYQDPMGGMSSGLHIAIQAQQDRVVWMLLLLASNLELDRFPPEVHRGAAQLGVVRENQTAKADIRSLRDAEGRTGEQLAMGIGGIWSDWVRRGVLAV